MARTSWISAFPALLEHPALSDRDRRVIADMAAGYRRKGSAYMTPGRRRYFHGIAERSDAAATAMAAREAGGTTDHEKRIEDVLARLSAAAVYETGTWSLQFVQSLHAQARQGRSSLSPKQEDTLSRIEAEYSTEKIVQMKEWANTWREDGVDESIAPMGVQLAFRRAIEYYSTTEYYKNVIADYRACSTYVPSFRVWKQIVDNSYAKKVLAAYRQTPKYAAGSLVSWRAGASCVIAARCLTVISTGETVVSAAAGAKRYRVLPVGSAKTILVEERDIKRYRG